jgi:hypothetical protein
MRAAFFQRNADIFKVDGSATIEQVLQACADKLAAGFAAVTEVAKVLEAKQDSNLKDCPVAVFDGNVPESPREPILGGNGGATGVGGGVIEAQEGTRKLPISRQLHDILEFAGRETSIDVEIYSGGQPPAGPNRTGSHRHDVGPGLIGAADLHMLDARTGRILDSDNQDDRKRIADFITQSVAAGATGVGHAPGYMGSRSTHIGGGEPVIAWGTGNSHDGAPDWVIKAFERGRAHLLTPAQVASDLSNMRQVAHAAESSPSVLVNITDIQKVILDTAAQSALASYKWKERGRAPIGYIKGMALAYARVVKKLLAKDPLALEMAKPLGSEARDALTWYNLDGSTDLDRLRTLFTLEIGLGMRESSGNFCEGRDRSASNTQADTAEAGLFQMSWDITKSVPLIKKVYDSCSVEPLSEGLAGVFHQGVNVTQTQLLNFGAGRGADFQRTAKEKPIFAVEAAAVGLRNNRKHWGPITRKEAEVRPEADALLRQIEAIVTKP